MNTSIRSWVLCLFIFCVIGSSGDPAAAMQLVSVSGSSFPTKLGGSGDSGLPIMSQGGRYVLFASTANNLTVTNNFNLAQPFRFNVFLRDNFAHSTALVSVNQNGTGGNGDSFPTGISTNGRFALFESSASDLVAGDTNGTSDVFVRDLVAGTTSLVSVGTNGSSAAGTSRGSVLTPDGRYVAFTCTASNLVAGDTNNIPDVFVRDLQTSLTRRISLGSMATNPSTRLSSSEAPEITPDGRYVAFCSTATNLVSKVTSAGDVYVRDLVAGQTYWASTNARVIAKAASGNSNIISCNYSLSDDGQFVAFEACSNSVGSPSARGIILRYNTQSGLTDTIYTNANVPVLPFEMIHNLSLSSDGRFVAFVTGGSTFSNSICLWDAQIGTNQLVSVSLDNVTPANGVCDAPLVSANGQFVAFVSSATNLVTNSLVGDFHVYVRDRQAGVTQLLDADTNGVGVGVEPTVVPAISADGSVVVFDCASLLPDNRHLIRDVFARAVAVGTNDLVSASQPTLSSPTPNGSSGITDFSASLNGRYVAFYSEADNLVFGDTNGFSDVFVGDLVGGTNILVSVNTNGNSGDNGSFEPAISGEGHYVAFTSRADDLVPGDTNRALDVFVRDLQAGTTTLISVSTNGADPGNADSFSPVISADGRFVLFHSKAANLAAGFSVNTIENLFFCDMQTGTTYPLTASSSSGVVAAAMTPDGQSVAFIGTPPGLSGINLYVWNSQLGARIFTNAVNASFPFVAISQDGQKVAYFVGFNLVVQDLVASTVATLNANGTFPSHAGFHFSNDGRFFTYAMSANASAGRNIYRYDFQFGTNLLVSQNYNFTGAASTNSDGPAISPDGRFIAYRSFANNLVPFNVTDTAQLYVYDSSNNATLLVSLNDAGKAAADRSLKPVFSADNRTLFFQSWAPDINGHDFNNGSDIFALDLAALPLTATNGLGGTNAAVFSVQFFPTGIFNSNPTLTWPLAAGKTYQVQYKTNLTDTVWQALPANLILTGGTGYVSDSTSVTTGQRFYRIVSSP